MMIVVAHLNLHLLHFLTMSYSYYKSGLIFFNNIDFFVLYYKAPFIILFEINNYYKYNTIQ